MSLQSIFLPLFVQVGLVFVLLLWLVFARGQALKNKQIDRSHDASRGEFWPAHPRHINDCLLNQFQLPVLFYVLVLLAWGTQKADLLFVVLSWVFVISRLVHAWIHTGSNTQPARGIAFAVGAFVLLAMWVLFALRILLAF